MATNSTRRGGSGLRKAVGSAVSSETVVDLISRLGLLDIAVDKLRQRLESADIDDFFDDLGDYLKRNPEVIVVLLGTITVAVGMIVYLERQGDVRTFGYGDDAEFDEDEGRGGGNTGARGGRQQTQRPQAAAAGRRRATT